MKQEYALLLAILILALPTAARSEEPEATSSPKGQDVDEAIEAITTLPEIEVSTPLRGSRPIFDVPRSTTLIPAETIREHMPRHLVDVIARRDPGIVMDMRTSSTGDPIMRGFAGFNILTLVDGNTLSTLWGEGGFGADDMYGKVDPDTIERVEIVHGPSSVLYGSNALGGVINFLTRSCPIDYQERGGAWGGRVKLVYESNMRGVRARTELWGATNNVKVLAGVTHARQNDARSGAGGQTLDPTSGRETNWDLRTDVRVAEGHELTFTASQVHRSDQHRYYRPTQDNKTDRWALGLRWTAEELAGFMAPFTWRAYYQVKRDQRRWLDSGKHGKSRTVTWSTDLQASTDLGGDHVLTYGLHANVDVGESPDDEQFTITKPHPEKADAPDSHWANYAVYLQNEWEAVEDLLTLTGALRYDTFAFQSHHTDTYRPPVGDPALDTFRDTTGAWTGGLSATVKPSENWRCIAGYSRGFRQFAPNFGIRQLGNGVLVPNELLDPVTANNYEVGFRARYPEFTAEGFVYYTDIDDWQALRPDAFEGSDWYDFNGNGMKDANEEVISQQAVSGAYVWGFSLKATVPLTVLGEEWLDGFSVWGGFAWNRGKVSDGEYLRHTQPARGIVGVRWDDPDPDRAAYVELITEMVNRYHRIPDDRVQKDLAYRREPQDKTSPLLRSYGGVPGYTVLSLYAGVNVLPEVRVSLAVSNLTNKRFRRAHSRMDAFGINFVLGVEVRL